MPFQAYCVADYSRNDYEVRHSSLYVFVSFPQKRDGIVFSSGVNYLHSD